MIIDLGLISLTLAALVAIYAFVILRCPTILDP